MTAGITWRSFMRRGKQVEATDAEAHREYKYDPVTNTLTVLYLAEAAPPEVLQASSMLAGMMAQLELAQQEGLIEINRRTVRILDRAALQEKLLDSEERFISTEIHRKPT